MLCSYRKWQADRDKLYHMLQRHAERTRIQALLTNVQDIGIFLNDMAAGVMWLDRSSLCKDIANASVRMRMPCPEFVCVEYYGYDTWIPSGEILPHATWDIISHLARADVATVQNLLVHTKFREDVLTLVLTTRFDVFASLDANVPQKAAAYALSVYQGSVLNLLDCASCKNQVLMATAILEYRVYEWDAKMYEHVFFSVVAPKDYKYILCKHSIPVATVLEWYMRTKTSEKILGELIGISGLGTAEISEALVRGMLHPRAMDKIEVAHKLICTDDVVKICVERKFYAILSNLEGNVAHVVAKLVRACTLRLFLADMAPLVYLKILPEVWHHVQTNRISDYESEEARAVLDVARLSGLGLRYPDTVARALVHVGDSERLWAWGDVCTDTFDAMSGIELALKVCASLRPELGHVRGDRPKEPHTARAAAFLCRKKCKPDVMMAMLRVLIARRMYDAAQWMVTALCDVQDV